MAFITPTPMHVTAVQTRRTTVALRPKRPLTGAVSLSASLAKPLVDRVLVRPHDPSTKSLGGIYVSSTQEQGPGVPKTGEVLAVGPGRYSGEGVLESTDFVKPGDQVVWKHTYGSQPVETEDGEELLALRIFSIIAKYSK